MLKRICRAALTAGAILLAGFSAADDHRLTIYIDADFTLMPAPAQAIELGLRTAFAGTWAEEGIDLIIRDHRANSRRSFDSILLASQDASALAVVGGMHSPPYLIHGDAINAAQIPLLLPWSAGGLLTRQAQGMDNWIFRLSVDDIKAADYLVGTGLRLGCQNPSIIYVDNSWGEGNATSIGRRLEQQLHNRGTRSPLALNASDQSISETVATIDSAGNDCVFLVSGLRLGAKVLQSLAALPAPPQVISHWGLLGARIDNLVSVAELQRLNLVILGTCGLSDATRESPNYAEALARAGAIDGGDFRPEHHPAIHGFFHAHDLGKLILQAIEDAHVNPKWHGGPANRRHAFRDALYSPSTAVHGLLKRYERPFTPVAIGNPDGHEALGFDDLCLTGIDENGHLSPLPQLN